MNLTYATLIVLASMIFVLSAMVGYLYWQHTRLHQSLQSLGMVVAAIVNPPELPNSEPTPTEPAVPEQVVDIPTIDKEEDDEEDDRISVEHISTEPEPIDIDDLSNKTKSQLQEMLKDKGIPYAKSDSKSVLIELLKATA
jgi:hypothetical protein